MILVKKSTEYHTLPICDDICTYVNICIRICIYIYIYVCVSIYMYTYMYIYIYVWYHMILYLCEFLFYSILLWYYIFFATTISHHTVCNMPRGHWYKIYTWTFIYLVFALRSLIHQSFRVAAGGARPGQSFEEVNAHWASYDRWRRRWDWFIDISWDRPDDEYFVGMSWKMWMEFKIHKFRQYALLVSLGLWLQPPKRGLFENCKPPMMVNNVAWERSKAPKNLKAWLFFSRKTHFGLPAPIF